MFVETMVNQPPGGTFTEVKAMIHNQSAFPARALKNGTLRYWFTLDSGDSAANLTLSANYSGCGPADGQASDRGRHALLRRARLRRPEHLPRRPVAAPA